MLFFSLCVLFVLVAYSTKESRENIEVIKFADAGWESICFHNSVAQLMIEEGYGYEAEGTSGKTATTIRQRGY